MKPDDLTPMKEATLKELRLLWEMAAWRREVELFWENPLPPLARWMSVSALMEATNSLVNARNQVNTVLAALEDNFQDE